MRISRIPAEAGKALGPRRDGKTAHNLQQTRYLAIISRRLAPLNEKWGKSSLPTPTLLPTFRCRLSRFLARPQPVNTVCVEIVFHGWRAKVLRHPRRGTSNCGPARDFTSERPQREGRNLLRPRFSTLSRLYTANSSIDPAAKHGIFATNDAKALKALRTLRPTLFDCWDDGAFGDDGSGHGRDFITH